MEEKHAFKKHVFSFLLFAMIAGVVLVLIVFANWLPLTLQKETLRRYSGIEEVKIALPGLHVYVPTYFPQTISWPPEQVFAQKIPFPWILMKFRQRGGPDDGLIITQSRSDHAPRHKPGALDQVTEKVSYDLRGREAVLEVGLCSTGEQCSRLSWPEGEYRLSVFMTSGPFELIKIAESMLH